MISALAVVALAGCGQAQHATHASVTVRKQVEPTAALSARPAVRIEGDGSLIAPYGADSLESFVQDKYVADVVTGEVVGARSVVLRGNYVATLVTIRTDGSADDPSRTIVTRESGGTVPMADVRSDFEGHVSADKLDAEKDQLVQYVGMEPNSVVGQHVLIMLAKDIGDGSLYSAATMVRKDDGSYGWAGDAPNPQWETGIDAATADELARAKPTA